MKNRRRGASSSRSRRSTRTPSCAGGGACAASARISFRERSRRRRRARAAGESQIADRHHRGDVAAHGSAGRARARRATYQGHIKRMTSSFGWNVAYLSSYPAKPHFPGKMSEKLSWFPDVFGGFERRSRLAGFALAHVALMALAGGRTVNSTHTAADGGTGPDAGHRSSASHRPTSTLMGSISRTSATSSSTRRRAPSTRRSFSRRAVTAATFSASSSRRSSAAARSLSTSRATSRSPEG